MATENLTEQEKNEILWEDDHIQDISHKRGINATEQPELFDEIFHKGTV